MEPELEPEPKLDEPEEEFAYDIQYIIPLKFKKSRKNKISPKFPLDNFLYIGSNTHLWIFY
jgi:hypothetical protein